MPSIASPRAILAAILLTENNTHGWKDQLIVIGVIGLVLLITWLFMHYSAILYKYIGLSGAAIISRVMGMILCSVAVVHILSGLTAYFQL
jgi:multiple antibiotic resistance protein